MPFVVLGQNEKIVYGATTHNMDVTDTYVEKLVTDPASPSGLSTVYMGRNEPVVAIPETFRVNPRTPGQADVLTVVPAGGAIPAQTLIVPRRNDGPVVSADLSKNMAVSVQYTGWKPTAEMDAFRLFNLARNLDDFRAALQYFDLGAQHWFYADLKGNIAYFTVAEVPIREDLQAGSVEGNPPYLLRNGQGGNEWLAVRNPQPQQRVPYEIIPFNEFPQTVNPPAGFVVTANNDGFGTTFDNNVLNLSRPGGGIYYPSHTHNGYRAGRITDLLRAAVAKGRITQADVISMQADVTEIDAQFFTPIITNALARARRSTTPQLVALANDPRVVEAVGRMSRWNHAYPTGIPQGYDSSDRDGRLGQPTRAEIDSSVAGTIFTLWRGRFLSNVIDNHVRAVSDELPLPDGHDAVKALRQLMVDFDSREGVGRSGIDFFAVAGIADAADRRDFLVLQSLAQGLTLAASDSFTAAFGNSTNQNDYRWGKLHRYQFTSVIGAPYAVPSAGNPFTSPLPGLPGIPVDGGFQVPDVYNFDVRADSPDRFVAAFPVPSRRFVAQGTRDGWRTVNSLAGGIDEEPGRDRNNLFKRFLTNDTYPVRMYPADLRRATDSVTLYVPARRT
jgi:penicillin amidase